MEGLAHLQRDVTPADPQAVADLLTADLGAPVAEVFQSFDPKPVAAASMSAGSSPTRIGSPI